MSGTPPRQTNPQQTPAQTCTAYAPPFFQALSAARAAGSVSLPRMAYMPEVWYLSKLHAIAEGQLSNTLRHANSTAHASHMHLATFSFSSSAASPLGASCN